MALMLYNSVNIFTDCIFYFRLFGILCNNYQRLAFFLFLKFKWKFCMNLNFSSYPTDLLLIFPSNTKLDLKTVKINYNKSDINRWSIKDSRGKQNQNIATCWMWIIKLKNYQFIIWHLQNIVIQNRFD
jgi:hypothetical protein